MDLSIGFPYRATPSATILVLGSMPGAASLSAGEYYAHPRNQFWRIAGELLDFDPKASYESRVRALNCAGIALWDVLQSCVRSGSLDSRIETRSAVVNDFATFFALHPGIARICFNGATAEKLFVRAGLAELGHARVLLPSTSPAHATMPFERKLSVWRRALSA
jgi:hypoxanthine-DNA glycosylase